MVLERAFAAAGDEDHLLDPGLARLLDRILDQRPVDDRQHLLGHRLGRGQEAGAEARRPGKRPCGRAFIRVRRSGSSAGRRVAVDRRGAAVGRRQVEAVVLARPRTGAAVRRPARAGRCGGGVEQFARWSAARLAIAGAGGSGWPGARLQAARAGRRRRASSGEEQGPARFIRFIPSAFLAASIRFLTWAGAVPPKLSPALNRGVERKHSENAGFDPRVDRLQLVERQLPERYARALGEPRPRGR